MNPHPSASPASPRRTVVTGDGVAWMQGHDFLPEEALVTSLPDVSELPALGFEGWRDWFVETATLACTRVHARALAVFYQTDIRRGGRWIDKGYLVARGAQAAGAECLFHRIVCRVPPGTATPGRPGYAHLLGFSRGLEAGGAAPAHDVLPELGRMTWTRAMGTAACAEVCRYVLRATPCRTVLDPFCGLGTMLAMANAFGLDAVGVELSPRRAAKARRLTLVAPEGGA